MNPPFNIVDLIENNPISRLTNKYQNKLLTKIKANFTDNEQQIFVASFYCFLNYDSRTDFVIDLDNVWQWLGFLNKANSKRLLEKQFVINKDYKILLISADEQRKHVKGGHNKETIMLNVETFKKFCLKAGTKKADEIHDYYIRLEQTLQEVIHEESTELKLQLEQKSVELQKAEVGLQQAENMKDKIREKTLLEQFGNNTQCVYYGLIDNVIDTKNEKLIKFGNSNNLKTRVSVHKDTYKNFRLMNAFKVQNKLQIENAIKENALLRDRHRTITIRGKKYIEILNVDGLLLSALDKIIKDIIVSVECTPENYIKIMNENKILKKQIEQLKQKDNVPVIEDQQPPYVKRRLYEKNKDGVYNIDGKIYQTLTGSRKDVYDGISYRTPGLLTKSDIIMNKYGKIVSRKKSIEEKICNKLEQVNLAKKKIRSTPDDNLVV
jgi:hypothetical protein